MTRPLSNFAPRELQNLRAADVTAAMLALLDAVQADQVPLAARAEMHAYYDRFQPWRRHFLHHYVPFVCQADGWFDVPRTQPRLLDLGCGVASQAHLLAARGAEVVGLDQNAGRIAAGRAMTGWFAEFARQPSLNVTLYDVNAFTWLEQQPAASFDGCYTQFALAYMKPHARMLELIDHVVRPGGRILFREFNAGSLYNRVIARVDWLTAAGYQRNAERLGWTQDAQRFHWLFPRRMINWRLTHRWLCALEMHLTRWRPIGPWFGGAMTLQFQKNSDVRNVEP